MPCHYLSRTSRFLGEPLFGIMKMFPGEKKKEHDECISHFEIAQRFDGEDAFNDIKAGRLAD